MQEVQTGFVLMHIYNRNGSYQATQQVDDMAGVERALEILKLGSCKIITEQVSHSSVVPRKFNGCGNVSLAVELRDVYAAVTEVEASSFNAMLCGDGGSN